MKTLLYSLTVLLLGHLAQAKEVHREASAKHSINAKGINNLVLDAHNTDTNIELWEKDEVLIEANFYYRGEEDHKKINEFLASFSESVKAGVSKGSSEIIINTYRAIPSKKKLGWENFALVDLAFSKDEAKLIYHIKIPARMALNIKHSYKDLQIKGKIKSLDIEQYSGRLAIDDLERGTLSLKYGRADIRNLGQAKLYLYEEEVSGEDWADIDLNAKYSKLRVRNINKLQGQGYETKYRFIGVERLSGDYKYSSVESENISLLNISCYECDWEVKTVKDIRLISSKYSSYTIDQLQNLNVDQSFEDNYSFQFAGNISCANSKYTKLKLGALSGNYSLSGFECKTEIVLLKAKSGKINIDGKYLNTSIGTAGVDFKLESSLQYGNLSYPVERCNAKLRENGTTSTASLSTKNIAAEFYTINVTGYEVSFNLR